jgi:hypothetical protein
MVSPADPVAMRSGRAPFRALRLAALCVMVACGAAAAQSGPNLPAGAPPARAPAPVGPWPSAGAAELTRGTASTSAVRSSGETPGFGQTPAAFTPQAVVGLFEQGCLAHEGELQRVVDWAISAGLEPLDPKVPDLQALLEGRDGAVLAVPGTEARVMIAAASDRHCIVWAEQANGPGVRLALLQALGERETRGARVAVELDRQVERAGAWRQQTQWRYRRAGGSDHLIGAVTTLAERPAAQVLRFAPPAPALGTAPDGTPIR